METPLQYVLFALSILGAATWLSSVVLLELRGQRVREHGTGEELVTFATGHARLAQQITFPAALLALVAGIWLAVDTGRSIADEWWLGSLLGLWIVAFLGSLLLRAARLRAVVKSAETHGGDAEDPRWRLRQVLLLARGELLILCVAAALAIIQPS